MSAHLRVALALGGIAAITVIGACTSGSSGSSSEGGGGAAGRAAGQSNRGALLAPPKRHDSALGATPSPASGAYSGGTSATGGTLTDRYTAVEVDGAKIRIVQMNVRVARGASVAAQANSAEAIAVGAGGEVDADDRSSGRYAQATLVLKVPPEQLAPVLGQLSRLGHELSRRQSTQDVTARVADVDSRVESAQREIARLRVLYQHASKVSDVIRIESELSQRESDLESLQAQQRALSAETSLASVTLTLTSPPVKPAIKQKTTHHDDNGFVGGLRSGWHAFTGGLSVLATVIGAVLPFALLLAVAGLLVRLLWPRLRPRRSPAPAASDR